MRITPSKSRNSKLFKITRIILTIVFIILGAKIIYDINNPTYFSLAYKKEVTTLDTLSNVLLGLAIVVLGITFFLIQWYFVSTTLFSMVKFLLTPLKGIFNSLLQKPKVVYLLNKLLTISTAIVGFFFVFALNIYFLGSLGFFIFPTMNLPPPRSVSLNVSGPTEVKANEPFEIVAVLSINRDPQQRLTIDGNKEKNTNPFETKNEIKNTKSVSNQINANNKSIKEKPIEYLSSTRLQSGFATTVQGWQEKKKVTSEKDSEWRWILTPALDRFGNQPILIEGVVYGEKDEILAEAKPVRIFVNVQTPLGLPWWVGYSLTLFGGLSIFAWIWDFVKERWIKKESAKEPEKPIEKPSETPQTPTVKPPDTIPAPPKIIEEQKKTEPNKSPNQKKGKDKKPPSN